LWGVIQQKLPADFSQIVGQDLPAYNHELLMDG
jgi:hypothetical protein